MPLAQRPWMRTKAWVGLGLALTLAVASLGSTTRADAAPASGVAPAPHATVACPQAMPVSAVEAGMTGEGHTVVRGSTPQPFAVEVLGVLANGLGAGRDLILVQVSDLPGGQVVDQGGGIWAGMSGSPVYVDGKLLGAISYSFTLAPSRLGGVTPAEDMYDVLNLSGAAAARRAAAAPATVTVPAGVRRQMATRTDAADGRTTATMRRLPLPLSVGGVSTRRVQQLQADATAAGLPVLAHNGSSRAAPAAEAPFAEPVPGGNFSAALAYGDLTLAATGTTTAVCDGQALAFGHPFTQSGPVRFGAHDASALAIARDETLGSYKLANLGAPFGVVDQDRTAAVRADLGAAAAATLITTTVHNADSGRSRTGTTSALAPEMLPEISAYAALANYDTVFDEIGDGSATSRWTITGVRANGATFTVRRSNRWASRDDISVEPAMELALAVETLINNVAEPVRITKISFDSTISTTFRQRRISKMAVSVNGGKFTSPERLRLRSGATVRVRVTMKDFRSSATTTTTATLKVPKGTAGQPGALVVAGGADLGSGESEEFEDGCLLGPEACGEEADESLSAAIRAITSVPRNDDVVVSLFLASEESFEDEDAELTPAAGTVKRQGQTVSGTAVTEVAVQR